MSEHVGEESTQSPESLLFGLGQRRIFTVSELTRQIKEVLEGSFPLVWVEGEISEPKLYPSGHLWFDLKDAHATMKSVMWRDEVSRLKFRPEQGLQVICRGRVEFYAPRGEVKFVAETLEPKGMGALQLAFEQLKEKLQKEGLFDEARKRPLPVFPERIGMVTSPRGAAIDDMLKLLRGNVEVCLWPCRVQGGGSAESIAQGIHSLNRFDGLDLLIVGRGGGSLEDLWAFNEEIVARAIAQSKLPVISAVGHEKDVTISDLVADVRAPTPTKGAEMVLTQRRESLDRLAAVLENEIFTQPEEWLKELEEKAEELEATLAEGLEEPILTAAQNLRILHGDLLRFSPQVVILHQAQRLHGFEQNLLSRMMRTLENFTGVVHGLGGRLSALSPLAVLERGYSITFEGATGKIVRNASQVKQGDPLHTRLHRGIIRSRVESTTSSDSEDQQGESKGEKE